MQNAIWSKIKILGLLGLVASTWQGLAQYAQVGDLAPDFNVPRYRSNESIRLTDFSGSIVVIDFFRWW